VGTELLRMEGQTDMTKLIVGFRNFCNQGSWSAGREANP